MFALLLLAGRARSDDVLARRSHLAHNDPAACSAELRDLTPLGAGHWIDGMDSRHRRLDLRGATAAQLPSAAHEVAVGSLALQRLKS